MKSITAKHHHRHYEVEDLYRPKGRHEIILRNETNDDNSVISVTDIEPNHVHNSLEMELLEEIRQANKVETEYSTADEPEKEYMSCRDSLEEALNILTGDGDDKRKSCTKLIAGVFVLSHVVHEFSTILNPHINNNNNNNCDDESLKAEDERKIISQTKSILISLNQLFKELQKLGKHSETFQKNISSAYKYCAELSRKANSEWNGEIGRLIVPKSKTYFLGTKSQLVTDEYETKWVLLLQSNNNTNNDESSKVNTNNNNENQEEKEFEMSEFSYFSTKPVLIKLALLAELIKRTRYLIALAHFQVQLARKTFAKASATRLFQKLKKVIILKRKPKRKPLPPTTSTSTNRNQSQGRHHHHCVPNNKIAWTISAVQKLFPTTRTLITLINSICEILQPSEIVARLTLSFITNIYSSVTEMNKKKNGHCSTGNMVSNNSCLKLFKKLSTSKSWFRIEVMLNSFADSLCIEEITLLMDQYCLILGRNYKFNIKELNKQVSHASIAALCPFKEALECKKIAHQGKYKHGQPDENEPKNNVKNVPVDPFDSQLSRGLLTSNSQQVSIVDREAFREQQLANTDVILAAASLSQENTITTIDIEGNVRDDNRIYQGPILIEVDMEGCPGSSSPRNDNEENNETSAISRNNRDQPEDIIETSNIGFHTLNFVLLLYNWWQRHSPSILIKLQNKVQEKIVQVAYDNEPNKAGSTSKVVETVKGKKAVIIDLSPPPEVGSSMMMNDPEKNESSNLIKWKEAKREYRKSSTPFANRTAKVRFNRIETCITSLAPGPYNPVIGGSTAEEEIKQEMKSILKKTEHPILVDLSVLSAASSISQKKSTKTLSNDELMVCVSLAERIIVHFSKAERQMRAVFDILSFPNTTKSVELMGRFRATMMVSIDSIHNIAIQQQESGELLGLAFGENKNSSISSDINEKKPKEKKLSKEMTRLNNLAESLFHIITNCDTNSKKFLATNKKLSAQWDYLLKKKGEFHIELQKTKQAIYHQVMPECVTLYEDFVEAEGILSIQWSANEFRLNTDSNSTSVRFDKCDLDQKYIILEGILYHAHDLIKAASTQLDIAVQTINDASLQAGYESIKTRIMDSEFDAYFDPLCALDLKNTLTELATRKFELLNLSEQFEECMSSMYRLTSSFYQYCTQVINSETKNDKKYKGVFCGLCSRKKFVTVEELLVMMKELPLADLWVSMPISSAVQTTMIQLQQRCSTSELGSKKSSLTIE